MVRFSRRWQTFGTSIFTTMTQHAMRCGAVNLAQGFPDFDGPDELIDAAAAAMRGGKNQYAPSPGIPELRRALAARQKTLYDLDYDANDEVTVFSGATEAIFCTLLALCDPGDEVLAIAPYYDSYPAAAMAAGAAFRTVALEAGSWQLDFAKLEAAITDRTRILMLNSPHNPTGKVFSRDELTDLGRLARQRDLIVMTDEVYEELVYSSPGHVPLATLPGMFERTVLISSTSKTFSMTGWKIGYAFAPRDITAALRAVHQFTVFCSATPLQWGMLEALSLPDTYFVSIRARYLAQRDQLIDLLLRCGFRCEPPAGTYFVMADYSPLSKEHDVSFARWLTETAKVASIPTSVFHEANAPAEQVGTFVRFAFCKESATLDAAERNFRAAGLLR